MAQLYSSVGDKNLKHAAIHGPETDCMFERLSPLFVSYRDGSGSLQITNIPVQAAYVWTTDAATSRANKDVNLNLANNRYIIFFLDNEKLDPQLYAAQEIDYVAVYSALDIIPIYYVYFTKWQYFQIKTVPFVMPLINWGSIGGSALMGASNRGLSLTEYGFDQEGPWESFWNEDTGEPPPPGLLNGNEFPSGNFSGANDFSNISFPIISYVSGANATTVFANQYFGSGGINRSYHTIASDTLGNFGAIGDHGHIYYFPVHQTPGFLVLGQRQAQDVTDLIFANYPDIFPAGNEYFPQQTLTTALAINCDGSTWWILVERIQLNTDPYRQYDIYDGSSQGNISYTLDTNSSNPSAPMWGEFSIDRVNYFPSVNSKRVGQLAGLFNVVPEWLGDIVNITAGVVQEWEVVPYTDLGVSPVGFSGTYFYKRVFVLPPTAVVVSAILEVSVANELDGVSINGFDQGTGQAGNGPNTNQWKYTTITPGFGQAPFKIIQANVATLTLDPNAFVGGINTLEIICNRVSRDTSYPQDAYDGVMYLLKIILGPEGSNIVNWGQYVFSSPDMFTWTLQRTIAEGWPTTRAAIGIGESGTVLIADGLYAKTIATYGLGTKTAAADTNGGGFVGPDSGGFARNTTPLNDNWKKPGITSTDLLNQGWSGCQQSAILNFLSGDLADLTGSDDFSTVGVGTNLTIYYRRSFILSSDFFIAAQFFAQADGAIQKAWFNGQLFFDTTTDGSFPTSLFDLWDRGVFILGGENVVAFQLTHTYTVPSDSPGFTLPSSMHEEIIHFGADVSSPTIDAASFVWVTNNFASTNSISQFNIDGSPISSPATINIGSPSGAAYINGQIWVVSGNDSKIHMFGVDGTPLSTTIDLPNNLYGLLNVGTQIWAINIGPNSSILRFNADGTPYSGGNITGNGLLSPIYGAVVNDAVWVTNESNTLISRFNFDGTPYSGGNIDTGRLEDNWGIAIVGSEVWVTNLFGGIYRYNFDGTFISDGNVPTSSSGDAGHNYDIAMIGNLLWTANYIDSTLSLFDLDTTSAGSISGNSQNGSIALAVLSDQVWVINYTDGTISRFTHSGAPYSGGNLAGNGLGTNYGCAVIGSQVWIANYTNSLISRFNFDGTTNALGNLAGNGLSTNFDMKVVGTQVWVANNSNSLVSRFNFDGTSAGSNLTGNGINGSLGLGVVNTQAWVANYNGNTISRFNFDGTSAGSVLSGNGLSNPAGVCLVGSVVWVANVGNSTISRFNTDGTTYSGGTLSGNSLDNPEGIIVIGSKVWVANPSNNTISIFNTDGTVGGTALSGNGLDQPRYIVVVGSVVWVSNYANSTISIFNTDGTVGDAPLDGNQQNGSIGITVVNSNQVWVSNYTDGRIVRYNFDKSPYGGENLTGNGLNGCIGITVVGSIVWVQNYTTGNISRFTETGAPIGPVLTGTGVNSYKLCTVGSQVWTTDGASNTLTRFNTDGTLYSGGAISGNGLNYPIGITVDTNNIVWAGNYGDGTISRFHLDGTPVGSPNPIVGNGINDPRGIAVVGSEVWVANVGFPGNFISIFNFDGTAGTGINPISGNNMNNPEDILFIDIPEHAITLHDISVTSRNYTLTLEATATGLSGLAVWYMSILDITDINNPVIVAQVNNASPAIDGITTLTKDIVFHTPAVNASLIWVVNAKTSTLTQFNSDGTSTQPSIQLPIFHTGSYYQELAIVGAEIWVADEENNIVVRLNPDGSLVGNNITLNNILGNVNGLAVVGSQVWIVQQSGNSHISRWNFDGSSIDSFAIEYNNCYGIVNIGAEVWISSFGSPYKIIRLDTSGNFIATITGGNIDFPWDMVVVGNTVWLANNDTISNSVISPIVVFDFMGTQLTTIPVPLQNGNEAFPSGLAIVGSEVWLTCTFYNGDGTNDFIVRYDQSGNFIAFIVNSSLNEPQGIAAGTISIPEFTNPFGPYSYQAILTDTVDATLDRSFMKDSTHLLRLPQIFSSAPATISWNPTGGAQPIATSNSLQWRLYTTSNVTGPHEPLTWTYASWVKSGNIWTQNTDVHVNTLPEGFMHSPYWNTLCRIESPWPTNPGSVTVQSGIPGTNSSGSVTGADPNGLTFVNLITSASEVFIGFGGQAVVTVNLTGSLINSGDYVEVTDQNNIIYYRSSTDSTISFIVQQETPQTTVYTAYLRGGIVLKTATPLTWDSTIHYNTGDFVTFTVGSTITTYIAAAPNINIIPSNIGSPPTWIAAYGAIPNDTTSVVILSNPRSGATVVFITNQGTWSSVVQYHVGDVVSYNGINFIAFNNPPVGTHPGLGGGGGGSLGELGGAVGWDSTTTYTYGTLVIYNGVVWMAIATNTANIPTNIGSNIRWILIQGNWLPTEAPPSIATASSGATVVFLTVQGAWDNTHLYVLGDVVGIVVNNVQTQYVTLSTNSGVNPTAPGSGNPWILLTSAVVNGSFILENATGGASSGGGVAGEPDWVRLIGSASTGSYVAINLDPNGVLYATSNSASIEWVNTGGSFITNYGPYFNTGYFSPVKFGSGPNCPVWLGDNFVETHDDQSSVIRNGPQVNIINRIQTIIDPQGEFDDFPLKGVTDDGKGGLYGIGAYNGHLMHRAGPKGTGWVIKAQNIVDPTELVAVFQASKGYPGFLICLHGDNFAHDTGPNGYIWGATTLIRLSDFSVYSDIDPDTTNDTYFVSETPIDLANNLIITGPVLYAEAVSKNIDDFIFLFDNGDPITGDKTFSYTINIPQGSKIGNYSVADITTTFPYTVSHVTFNGTTLSPLQNIDHFAADTDVLEFGQEYWGIPKSVIIHGDNIFTVTVTHPSNIDPGTDNFISVFLAITSNL